MQYYITDLILELFENSYYAGASKIELTIDEDNDFYKILIKDNGKGMTEEEQKKALDPFYSDREKHPDRKIGLGLPFLVQSVKQCNGDFKLKSKKGKDTEIFFSMNKKCIDIPPLGDLPALFRTMFTYEGDYELFIIRRCRYKSYHLSRNDIVEIFEGDIHSVGSLKQIYNYFVEQEKFLFEGDNLQDDKNS